MGYVIGIIGMWLLSDGIISWNLYKYHNSYQDGKQQTFVKDHWVRLVRIVCSIILIYIGWRLA